MTLDPFADGLVTTPPLPHTWGLTFTKAGVYPYVCYIHAEAGMIGNITVVPSTVHIPSPMQVMKKTKATIKSLFKKAKPVYAALLSSAPGPVANGDGTFTHHVSAGAFSQGYMFATFVPPSINVGKGDTVIWTLGSPFHTITFLNGMKIPGSLLAETAGVVSINFAIGAPSGASTLTQTGIFSSGILQAPGQSYTLTIGNVTPGTLAYLCTVHASSGMHGKLVVS